MGKVGGSNKKTYNPEVLKSLVNQGFPTVQIADRMGASAATVCKWMRECGIHRTRGWSQTRKRSAEKETASHSSEKCYSCQYRNSRASDYGIGCNYSLITRKCRGCKAEECTVYVKGAPLKVREEF